MLNELTYNKPKFWRMLNAALNMWISWRDWNISIKYRLAVCDR